MNSKKCTNMKKIFENLKVTIFKHLKIVNFDSKNSLALFYECLQKCYTLEDIATLKTLVQLCSSSIPQNEIIDLVLNIDYRKRIIIYADYYLPKQRYTALEIRNFFNATDCYAVCDAILLHIEKNNNTYLNKYEDLLPMQSTEIFTRMATKRKTYILENYTKCINQKISA